MPVVQKSKSKNLCSYTIWLACVLAVLISQREPICVADVHFPSDPSLPYKFGLFIGVNKYSKLADEFQLDGCVNDAQAMQKLFADSFDVHRSVLLTDEQATRQGICQALEELYRQVKAARSVTQKPIDVVITYSGHGTRVLRLPSENDPNNLDNAWVASDSTRNFDQVVRGHELLELHTALAKLNAQVLIISDSCFSGSGYRGVETAKARFISDGLENAPGPQSNFFSDLQIDDSTPGSVAPSANQPLPGFVYYSACSDGEEAHEYTDTGTNQHWGRLTYVLSTFLRQQDQPLTYEELAGDITVKFASLWPNQHPEFHAAPGKGGDLFLHAGDRPPHSAAILAKNDDGTLELNLGSLDGVADESHFRFFASLNDLVNHGTPIGSAAVTALTPLTCTVKPDTAAVIPANARAMMDEVRMSDFVVGFDGDVPQPIHDKLQEMDKNKQIRLASGSAPYTIAIHYFPLKHTVGFYLPSALPGGRIEPEPIRMVGYTGPSDVDIVGDNLLYVALVQRLMTLKQEGTDPLVDAQVVPQGPPSPATQPADGLVHVREGGQIILKLTNKTAEVPLYFWVFVVGSDGDLTTLYPTGGQTEPIPAGKSLEIGRYRKLNATIDRTDLPSGGADLTKLKVIATTKYLDLQSLTVAPSTNMEQASASRGLPGADDPLLNLLNDAAHGGAGTRGLVSLPPDIIWDSADVAMDVIKN